MKTALRFTFSTLAGALLVAGALAVPPAHTQQTQEGQQAAAAQSVSGKITSVEKNSFTLTLSSTTQSSVSEDMATSQDAPKTMSFTIDQNTTIEGKLKVGASADVTYRQENGANVAISVHVTP
jgi:Cu/Ag efflux protein CusF